MENNTDKLILELSDKDYNIEDNLVGQAEAMYFLNIRENLKTDFAHIIMSQK